MPLDTGVLTEVDLNHAAPILARRQRLTLDPMLDIGSALKAGREALGLSLDQVAEVTRVRVGYLRAIETSDVDRLPSRPFAIGYVRSYAKALGCDADAAAARYRAEHPSPDDELHSPAGVAFQRAGRNRLAGVVVALAALAVVGWNVVRHATADPPRHAPAVHAVTPHAAVAAQTGPFPAGAPLPAPPEATIPAPYATPGLAAASAAGGSADAADAAVKAASAAQAKTATPAGPPAKFAAQGTVYGPTHGASDLIIQATGPISLEVRGAGGVVYFARQLSAGQAYRVPNLPGLTAEASNPANAELFEGGYSKGAFPQAQIPLKDVVAAAARG